MLSNILKQANMFSLKQLQPKIPDVGKLSKLNTPLPDKEDPTNHFFNKASQFGNSKGMNILSNAISSFGGTQKIGSNLSTGIAAGAEIASGISKVAEHIPVIGGFAKVGNALTGTMNSLGLGNDGVTGVDAIMGSTPLGFLNFGVGKLNNFKVDKEANSTGAFMGSTDANMKAGDLSKKKVGWMGSVTGGKRKLNNQIKDAKFTQSKMSDIVSTNKDMINANASMSQDLFTGTNLKRQGGFNPIAVGKKGIKLDIEKAKKILSNKDGIKSFTDTNSPERSFIPGGALHAHRHKIKDHDEDLANELSNKGVPVVAYEKGGEVKQYAEIERGEIILRLEVTKELEALREDGSEEAMIKAGKLLSEEIINNTDDKSKEYEIKNKK